MGRCVSWVPAAQGWCVDLLGDVGHAVLRTHTADQHIQLNTAALSVSCAPAHPIQHPSHNGGPLVLCCFVLCCARSKSKDRRRKGDLDPESDTASALGLGAPGGSVEQAVRDIVERSMALRAAAAGSQGGGAGGGNLPEAVAPVLAGVDMRPLYR